MTQTLASAMPTFACLAIWPGPPKEVDLRTRTERGLAALVAARRNPSTLVVDPAMLDHVEALACRLEHHGVPPRIAGEMVASPCLPHPVAPTLARPAMPRSFAAAPAKWFDDLLAVIDTMLAAETDPARFAAAFEAHGAGDMLKTDPDPSSPNHAALVPANAKQARLLVRRWRLRAMAARDPIPPTARLFASSCPVGSLARAAPLSLVLPPAVTAALLAHVRPDWTRELAEAGTTRNGDRRAAFRRPLIETEVVRARLPLHPLSPRPCRRGLANRDAPLTLRPVLPARALTDEFLRRLKVSPRADPDALRPAVEALWRDLPVDWTWAPRRAGDWEAWPDALRRATEIATQ